MYSFRHAHPLDIPWLDQACIAGAHESLSPEEHGQAEPESVAQLARQQMQGVMSDPGGVVIVATAWNQPVGFLAAALSPDSTTEEINGVLLTLWVAPHHRRRGVGRALLALGEAQFLRRGVRKMKVIAGVHNPVAVRMAERAGYHPEGLIGLKTL
ncbi:MAG TPA: GNAT family N-acetyltransferase [Symbiobacteriaceae bacterium]|nr:GNAT family N-acetyltransferase [Symbiobacteriaceae bacterium]